MSAVNKLALLLQVQRSAVNLKIIACAARLKNVHGGIHSKRVSLKHNAQIFTESASPVEIPSNVCVAEPHEIDNPQDGGPMSTSESEHGYNDADHTMRAVPLDVHGPFVHDIGKDAAVAAHAVAVEVHKAGEQVTGIEQSGIPVAPPLMRTPMHPHAGNRSQHDLESGRCESHRVMSPDISATTSMIPYAVYERPCAGPQMCKLRCGNSVMRC